MIWLHYITQTINNFKVVLISVRMVIRSTIQRHSYRLMHYYRGLAYLFCYFSGPSSFDACMRPMIDKIINVMVAHTCRKLMNVLEVRRIWLDRSVAKNVITRQTRKTIGPLLAINLATSRNAFLFDGEDGVTELLSHSSSLWFPSSNVATLLRVKPLLVRISMRGSFSKSTGSTPGASRLIELGQKDS